MKNSLLCAVVAIMVFIQLNLPIFASADVDYVMNISSANNFESIGAQIRLSSPAALRFVFTAYDDVENRGDYGILVQPEVYLNGRELNHDCIDGVQSGAKDIKCEKIFSHDDDSFTYTVAITGIKQNNYTRKYIAVPYKVVSWGATPVYTYGEALSYSLVDIAAEIYAECMVNGDEVPGFVADIINSVHEKEHINAAPVRENEVMGTCNTQGGYDDVVHCLVCACEIKRTHTSTGYGDHTFADGKCLHCEKAEEVVDPQLVVGRVVAFPGDTVDVMVSVKNNPGIFDMILSFTYDSSAMTLMKVTNGEVLSGSTFMAPKNMASGCRATWYYMDEPDEYMDGSVVKLTFEISDAAEAGEYPVIVGYGQWDINNYDGEPLSFEVINGSIQLGGTPHIHTPGKTVKENVEQGTCITQASYEEVVYCSECYEEISRILKNGDFGDHDFDDGICIYCGELEETDVPIFTIGKVSTSAGNSVSVDVLLKNNPGIFDMILGFTYDSAAMTLKSVTNGDVMTGATFMAPKNMASGCRATWYYMDEPDEYADGSVVILTFNVSDTASAGDYAVGVTYRNGDINNYDGESLSFAITQGVISVK